MATPPAVIGYTQAITTTTTNSPGPDGASTSSSTTRNILHRFRILKKIGNTTAIAPVASTSAPNDGASTSASASATTPAANAAPVTVPVYKAAYVMERNEDYKKLTIQDIFVAVVCVHIHDEPALNIMQSPAHLGKWNSIPDQKHLVGIIHGPFIYQGFYCVVFPFMELGSMKSIMAKHFPKGVPEKGILVILKEVLTCLKVIHDGNLFHREICSAHIYLNEKPEIKLGFSASVFDLDSDYQGSDQSSSTHIWAAAPELYGSGTSAEYSSKCDVWSIGFTALEMVYGGFEFINRKHLDYVLKKIRKKKKISGKRIVLKNVTARPPKFWKNKELLRTKVSEVLDPKKKKKYKKQVSKEFEEMVVKCLAEDPNERPTVDELLELKIFHELRKDHLLYFYNLFKTIKNNFS